MPVTCCYVRERVVEPYYDPPMQLLIDVLVSKIEKNKPAFLLNADYITSFCADTLHDFTQKHANK